MPILANSVQESKKVSELLNKQLPTYRQAYGDRTAWLMACLSELVYIKFNPFLANGQTKQHVVDAVRKLAGENKKTALLKLIDKVGYDHEKELNSLINELKELRLSLEKSFDCNGTQAILVKGEKFITLAFRGTEADSIRDIKSDCDARITSCESGGRIHTGFVDAFGHVALDIQQTLDKEDYKNLPLFITGHSLGGALATIAAKKLRHQGGIAACYTFGAPRVGDEDWSTGMKTQVYRIVNSADCVTMLPPSSDVMFCISWVAGLFSPWRKIIVRIALSGLLSLRRHALSDQLRRGKI